MEEKITCESNKNIAVERGVSHVRASYGERHFVFFRGISIEAIGQIKVLGKAQMRTKRLEREKGWKNIPLPSKMIQYRTSYY